MKLFIDIKYNKFIINIYIISSDYQLTDINKSEYI